MLLDGKVAIVSGVGPGVGRACALALAGEGADVAVVARNEARLREVAAEVQALGRQSIVLPIDVTDPEQCRRVAAQTHAAFGRIDVLINNAFSAAPVVRFAEGEVDDWRQAMEVNLANELGRSALHPVVRRCRAGRGVLRLRARARCDRAVPAHRRRVPGAVRLRGAHRAALAGRPRASALCTC